jgi:hypothetical protein
MLANAVRPERVIDDRVDGGGHVVSLWLLNMLVLSGKVLD